MSEYLHVEKPFLDQLAALSWTVVDHGPGVPGDPSASRAGVDYIVVHELCHRHHLDHTDAFWTEVDKVMPAYRERKEWLRAHGAGLDV